jgi:hypothetical protein
MTRRRIGRYLWIVGVALITLSALRIVSPSTGWIGFGIGVIGNLVGWSKLLVSTSEIFKRNNHVD